MKKREEFDRHTRTCTFSKNCVHYCGKTFANAVKEGDKWVKKVSKTGRRMYTAESALRSHEQWPEMQRLQMRREDEESKRENRRPCQQKRRQKHRQHL